MQSTFGGAGTFADVLTSSYGLNLPEYGEATADGAANNRQPQGGAAAASEAAAEAAALAAEAGHGGPGGGGSEGGGGHLITQLSAAQVRCTTYEYFYLRGCVELTEFIFSNSPNLLYWCCV